MSSDGTATLDDCAVQDNTVGSGGGGAFIKDGGTLLLLRTAVIGNAAKKVRP